MQFEFKIDGEPCTVVVTDYTFVDDDLFECNYRNNIFIEIFDIIKRVARTRNNIGCFRSILYFRVFPFENCRNRWVKASFESCEIME